jgi:hypothetical protein
VVYSRSGSGERRLSKKDAEVFADPSRSHPARVVEPLLTQRIPFPRTGDALCALGGSEFAVDVVHVGPDRVHSDEEVAAISEATRPEAESGVRTSSSRSSATGSKMVISAALVNGVRITS